MIAMVKDLQSIIYVMEPILRMAKELSLILGSKIILCCIDLEVY